MSLPTASTIMKLFLFGTTTPVDFVSEERIRPDNSYLTDSFNYRMDKTTRVRSL
ncbi:MAG TPA: hypothetical protein VES38_04800 [Methylotenera sp.]|nr:hypothetical protein [Methylotenera sp.]